MFFLRYKKILVQGKQGNSFNKNLNVNHIHRQDRQLRKNIFSASVCNFKS